MALHSKRIEQELTRGGVLPPGVAILIPAYNEAAHLPALIAACRAVRPAVVVVVDDASSDETEAVMQRVMARAGDVVYLRNERNLGKQGSVKRGLQRLAAMRLEVVALIDGDGQHDPAELPRLAALMQQHHADIVIGARSRREMPAHRQLSNWLVNLGFRVLGGVDLFDVQSGLRLYRKPLADLLAWHLPQQGGYGLEHESLALLAERWDGPLRVLGAPVSCAYGVARSKMSPAAMLALVGVTLRQALRLRLASRAAAARLPASGALPPTLERGSRAVTSCALCSAPERGSPAPRALTVEIHDISPATFEEARTLSRALRAVGVERPTLLVVPRLVDEQNHVWDLRQDGRLCAWLREEQGRGAEIVQHGLTHRAPGPPPPGVRNAVMHHWFSRGTAEFAHLDHREAVRRLQLGRQILGQCGLRSAGFIAPAWQQSEASTRALGRLGFTFTAFLNKVQVLAGASSPLLTPALTFAAPNALVDHGKRVVMRALEAWARPKPLLRVALHPEDLRGARPAEHAVRRVERLLRHRRLVTYSQWLAEAA